MLLYGLVPLRFNNPLAVAVFFFFFKKSQNELMAQRWTTVTTYPSLIHANHFFCFADAMREDRFRLYQNSSSTYYCKDSLTRSYPASSPPQERSTSSSDSDHLDFTTCPLTFDSTYCRLKLLIHIRQTCSCLLYSQISLQLKPRPSVTATFT